MHTAFLLFLSLAIGAATAGPWWQTAVIYQIYPRSFQDSNNDGIGDLRGITSRLEYVASLGVDAIWLNPIFPSPNVDFGYDVSDYTNIDPVFGTLSDFDAMLAEANRRGLRVLLDLVLNHSSDKHPWFIAASSNRSSPFHDWYVWSDGRQPAKGSNTTFRSLPDGRASVFGGSAWTWAPRVRQFYYHKFYSAQPDLNWRNPAVEAALFGAARFWLGRGVGGFRLDAVGALFQASSESDAAPETRGVLRRLRRLVDSFSGDRVLVGETTTPSVASLDAFYGGRAMDELHLAMDFAPFLARSDAPGAVIGFNASYFRARLADAETRLDGNTPLFVLDNHDNVRSATRFFTSRVGTGALSTEQRLCANKAFATLLLAPRGAALVYYGQEIGMRNADEADIDKNRGGTKNAEHFRDGERTPMQWRGGAPNAGFSAANATWLPVNGDFAAGINVKSEEGDAQSLLNWYKLLIEQLRRTPAFSGGGFAMADTGDSNILAFVRASSPGDAALVVINFSGQQRRASVNASDLRRLAWSAAGGHRIGSGSSEGGSAPLRGVVRTVLASAASLANVGLLEQLSMPPFASWTGHISS